MGRGKKVYIGDIEFSTQGEAKDYVRKLLLGLETLGHIDSKSEHWQFFSDLLARHSDYDEKRGAGIAKFIIGRNTNNDIELSLERVDGSPCDVSWIKCVTGKATSVISNLKAAMRVHIDYQISKFKEKNFYAGVGCAICSAPIKDINNCHVDHEIHFDSLVEEFIKIEPAHPVTFGD